MRTAIRKHLRDFVAMLGLAALALAVAGFILVHQRVRLPFIEETPFKLKAEFSTAQALTPGQGQTVRVAGVRIGDVTKVDLRDGRAVVTMEVDPQYRHLVHTDATALLRPKTGLKDMFIELRPGSSGAPFAPAGWTMPIRSTLPDINPDEVLSALDSDTRAYLQLLLNGAGRGLDHRGGDLQEVFRRFEPTHRDLAAVTAQVATRRRNLRRLVGSLHRLSAELASRDDDLAGLVRSSATVFRAFASENAAISRAVQDLPPALRQTTQTLGQVERFARVLAPTADRLRPAVRALDGANRSLRPFATETTPILRNRIRPFVRAARPLVTDLRPAASDLARATPDLTRSFVVLNHLFDLIAYNPNGREDPSNAARQESFLFWIAWVTHDTTALFASGDANGSFRPVFLGGECTTLKNLATFVPIAGEALNLAPILGNPTLCPP